MRALVVPCLLALGGVAEAQSVDARTIAVAGGGVVTADGAGALVVNPAGLGRRPSIRAQLGLATMDDGSTFDADAGGPTVTNHAGPLVMPVGGAQFGLGERVVVGVAWVEPEQRTWDAAEPPVYERPVLEDRELYPARYAATELLLRDRGVAAGVAALPVDWLAVGASVSARRVSLGWASTLWGGDDDVPADLDPGYDLRATADAADEFVPGVVVGFVIAPPELPLELAGAVSWSDDARLAGDADLRDSRARTAVTNTALVEARPFGAVPVEATLPGLLLVRLGARTFVGPVGVELDGELRRRDGRPTWRADVPFTLRRTETDEMVDVAELPVGVTFEDTWAVRGAVDVEVVPQWMVLLAGYGYESDHTHTAALGLEARVDGHAATLGAAYAFAGERAGEDRPVVAPFDDREHAALAGTVDSSALTIALTLEKEW